MKHIIAGCAALALLAAIAPLPSSAAGRCTSETLRVRSNPVTVSFCVTQAPRAATGSELLVPVSETYAGGGGSFSQAATLRFLSGEGTSRVIEDVALDRLGSAGTLHLTLVYAGGVVRVESAMLTPGAIVVK
jgi:hypothetical protein